MSSESECLAGDALWQQARNDYEASTKDLNLIAVALGINRFKLIAEARKRGWKLRSAKKNIGTRATIQRFKELLQKRLGQLENQLGEIGAEVFAATNERDIRAMNILVRTLEKVLELERRDRAHRSRKIKERRKFDDAARDELARRIRGLRREPDGSVSEQYHPGVSSAEPAEGLAQLGAVQSTDSA